LKAQIAEVKDGCQESKNNPAILFRKHQHLNKNRYKQIYFSKASGKPPKAWGKHFTELRRLLILPGRFSTDGQDKTRILCLKYT